MKSGVVILYKDENVSSQGAVNRVKRLFGVQKAGHTGTLDPLATGVLPVLIGRAVKASEYMITEDKHYRATILLGITTDTEDITGTTLSESDRIPCEAAVLEAVKSKLGASKQIPPMYSAIKRDGKKLYELAREGKTVEREPRDIFIYGIAAEKINDREYTLDVHCSKGTYIRTLCADIGAALGCGAVMKTLERTECAGFSLGDAHTVSELEQMSDEQREACVIPTERIFSNLKKITLTPFFARLARCGVEIYTKKIAITLPVGTRVTLFDENGFFAIGEVRDFDDGVAIKPIKQFDIS